MALIPKADFEVFLPRQGAVPGTRVEGTLRITVPEPIPRAEVIQLFWKSEAVAGYGSGKHRSVYRRDLFFAPLHIELDRTKPLPAGTFSYPFAIDLPPWLPPGMPGNDCSIAHRIEVRLDVDWAIDPKTVVTPIVSPAPVEIVVQPYPVRSPTGFHEAIVIDVTLDSNTIECGAPLTGQIALRGGHDARFDAINITLASMATIKMARGDRRRGNGMMARIPADALRGGQSVPFAITYPAGMPVTSRNGFIDHDLVAIVEVDIPWGFDPSFELPLQVVPAGSKLHRDTRGAGPVGAERLMRLAAAMAQATGLAQGRLPTLVDGRVGPIGVQIMDGPRGEGVGLDVSFEFPDVELGITFKPLGMLGGFRQSPLLPIQLANGYLLRAEPERAEGGVLEAPVAEEALKPFFASVLSAIEPSNEPRLTDHHLGLRLPLANDGGETMTECARWVRARAEILASAIAALPFSPAHAAAGPAWAATAAEQSAFLLPHVPAIHGITLNTRIVGGEQRTLGLTLRTRKDGTLAADLDLRGAPLPRPAWGEIDKGGDVEGLRPVRAVFPRIDVHSAEQLTLEGGPFAADPRPLLSTIELFFWWLLEARGERRTDAPYR